MERVVVFLDYANIDKSSKENNYKLDYANLADYISEGRFLTDCFAYVPIDPRSPFSNDKNKLQLWSSGYLVKEKVGTLSEDSFKCNMDIEMTIDILKIAHINKPDVIVILSGDGDFTPLVLELRNMGIRVEVASFKNSVSKDLIVKSSGFISLDSYIEELEQNLDDKNEQDEQLEFSSNKKPY